MRTSLRLCVCLALALARFSVAAPVRWAGNGHYYEYIDAPLISWTAANAAANSLTYAGLSGHLATITSAQENAFVTSLTPVVDGSSRVQAAHLGGYRATSGPSRGDGWVWVTGEPWSYTSWASGEPNNSSESYLALWMVTDISYRARGTWNDATNSGQLMAGYVVEYDQDQLPPEPNQPRAESSQLPAEPSELPAEPAGLNLALAGATLALLAAAVLVLLVRRSR